MVGFCNLSPTLNFYLSILLQRQATFAPRNETISRHKPIRERLHADAMNDNESSATTPDLLTSDVASSLLKIPQPSVFECADVARPWSRIWIPVLRDLFRGSVLDQLWDSVLLRTFDTYSGSQPDPQYRMLARHPRMRLDRRLVRRDTLIAHEDHGVWEPTPYISFTNSPTALQNLAEGRERRNRGDQSIVVVDPQTRFGLGLPVLHFMKAYGVQSRYRDDYSLNHYLCLWEVTPEEVVGIWEWRELCKRPNWDEEIISPAVEEYRKQRKRREEQERRTELEHHRVEAEHSDGEKQNGHVVDPVLKPSHGLTFYKMDDNPAKYRAAKDRVQIGKKVKVGFIADEDDEDDTHDQNELHDNDEDVDEGDSTEELTRMAEGLRLA